MQMSKTTIMISWQNTVQSGINFFLQNMQKQVKTSE